MLTLLLTTLLTQLPAQTLRTGAAQVRITPPIGTPLGGNYTLRPAATIHDELHAKALVLELNNEKAALVALDVVTIDRETVDSARQLIQQQTGIPPTRIMISATHTHSGPITGSSTHHEWAGSTHPLAREFRQRFPSLIAESVAKAHANLAASTVRAGLGQEHSLSINRRWLKAGGATDWNRITTPTPADNVIRPLGPIDPDINVLSFESTSPKRPLATYVNFAVHANCIGGTIVSADYPGTLSQLLAIRDPAMITLFTNGAAANINPLHLPEMRGIPGTARAERIGTILAGDVFKILNQMHTLAPHAITSASRIVSLPLAQSPAEEVNWARQIAQGFGKPGQAPFLDLVKASRVLDVARWGGKPRDAEVQVIALGREVAWVGVPGELFAELGLAIKRASPFPRTIVVELANDSLNYFPNRKAFAEGNYEPVSTRFAPGAGETLVDAATALLIQLF
ncbi:MAG: neutral/alkaline non-lysosomal ceramidase N-terminal domain-containing protein [Acidobacteria bacterium]|nr:neutral/alkaline non-lysosomal ceramidase N-terminal domain-containing protein [Acidobacteriota bacterium]